MDLKRGRFSQFTKFLTSWAITVVSWWQKYSPWWLENSPYIRCIFRVGFVTSFTLCSMIVYNYYTSIIYFYLLTDAVAFRTVAGPFPQLSHVCWSNPILCSLHSNSIYLSLYLYIILYSLFLTVSSSTFIMCILFSLSLTYPFSLNVFSLTHTSLSLSLSFALFSLSLTLFSFFFNLSLSFFYPFLSHTPFFLSYTHTLFYFSVSRTAFILNFYQQRIFHKNFSLLWYSLLLNCISYLSPYYVFTSFIL